MIFIFKKILIVLLGNYIILFVCIQIFKIISLFSKYKLKMAEHYKMSYDLSYFQEKKYAYTVALLCIVFTTLLAYRWVVSLIYKLSRRKNGEEVVNFSSLSSKYERKKGLVRIEFTKKGEVTQNTLRWLCDKIFNRWKQRYNRLLRYFKINPKHYLNTYSVVPNTSNSQLKYNVVGGIPIIAERKYFNLLGHYSKFWLSAGDIHSLFVGSTGRGKSITFVIAMLYFYALAHENVILNDPKGELLAATRSFFEKEGYNVVVLDFTDTKNSQIWNPLQIPLEEYKKEVTKYLFYLKLKIDEMDTEYSDSFVFGVTNSFEYQGNIFTIQEDKSNFKMCGKINSSIFNRCTIELFVQEILIWSRQKIVEKNKVKIAETTIKENEFVFQLNRSYIDGQFNFSKSIELLRDISNIITFEPNPKDPFWIEGAADMITGGALFLLEQGAEQELNYKSIRELYIDDSLLEQYMNLFTNENNYAKKYTSTYFSSTGNARAGLKSVFLNKMSLLDANDDIARITSNQSSFKLKNIGYEKTAVFIIVHDEKKTYHRLVSMFIKQLYEVLIQELREKNLQTLPIKLNLLLDEFGVMPAIKDVDTILAAARSRGIRFNAFIQSFEQLDQNYGKEIAKVIEDNCTNVIYLNSKTNATAKYFSDMAGKKIIKTKKGYEVVPVITADHLQSFPKGKTLITTIEKKPYISKLPPVFEYPMYQKPKEIKANIKHEEVKVFNLQKIMKNIVENNKPLEKKKKTKTSQKRKKSEEDNYLEYFMEEFMDNLE